RTAAHEITDRLADPELGPLVPRGQVGTLHSLAYHALDRPELVVGHIADWNEEHPGLALRYASSLDEPPDERVYQTDRGETAAADDEVVRARRVPAAAWPGHVATFAQAWEAWKAARDLYDFTDLIEHGLTDTMAPAPGREVLIVDEAQDLSALELALVRHWGAACDTVLLAGDDDQAIYGFRGATPDAFLDPPVDAEHKRVLHQSWRVPAAV